MDGTVYSLAKFGTSLYAAGYFVQAGGAAAKSIARWDGTSWLGLGSGLDDGGSAGRGFALATFDDGSGPALYVGGWFLAAGGVGARSIARWNGSAWSSIGDANGFVNALTVYDEGSGPRLYAGGNFTNIGGIAANTLATWNGASWSAVPTGIGTATVNSLAVFDDGSGPGLYVGGTFSGMGGISSQSIARWRGGAWSALGLGVGQSGSVVRSMTVYDDGGGPALYVMGKFFEASGTPAVHIARWRNSSWSAVDGGLGPNNSEAFASAVCDVGSSEPQLFVGGSFLGAGGMPSAYLAHYVGCPICKPNCDGSSTPPILNVNDYLCFLNSFAQGEPYANCDASTASPLLNVNDFLCFINSFAAGCP
jgi:hypothetical protein